MNKSEILISFVAGVICAIAAMVLLGCVSHVDVDDDGHWPRWIVEEGGGHE